MESVVKQDWDGDVFLNGTRSNARGVAILISNNFEYHVVNTEKDNEGNLLLMDLEIENFKFRIINIYGPNTDDEKFFLEIKCKICNSEQDHLVICGDFNLTLNPELDSYNYTNLNNPKARSTVLDMIEEFDLIDLFRYFNPDKKRYTWRRKNPLKQARLDYLLTSETLLDLVDIVDIKPSYKSDHSFLLLSLALNKFKTGRGTWKFNTQYLRDPQYLKMINTAIRDEYLKYAPPVYNLNYISVDSYPDLLLTIDNESFLEAVLLTLRGETIKHASIAKKRASSLENNLKAEIEILESENDEKKFDILEMKKMELEELRTERMKGQWVRSRSQWNLKGKNPQDIFAHSKQEITFVKL